MFTISQSCVHLLHILEFQKEKYMLAEVKVFPPSQKCFPPVQKGKYLPARESGGDRKVAASPLPQLHGMLHQVPGTLLHSAWYASPSTRYSAPGNQQAL